MSPPIPATELDGPGAPPRANGELVFEEPWEGRLFGLTLALHRDGAFEWEEFRALLIDEIARFEREHPDGVGYRYYACWQRALERLLRAKQLCEPAEIDRRRDAYAARPHGHDH